MKYFSESSKDPPHPIRQKVLPQITEKNLGGLIDEDFERSVLGRSEWQP
jgi:hypothetical protein